MRTLLSTAAAIALGVVLAAPASAQVGATFVLRSGEKVSGQLVDMNARGLVANVAGSERAWPLSDVAVVDFVSGGNNLPSNEVNQSGSGHLLVLRNGQAINGQLTDIGGRAPLRITFSSGSGTRDFSSDDVARIYLARPSTPAAANGSNNNPNNGNRNNGNRNNGSGTTGNWTVRVPARSGWVSTGLQVRQGEFVYLESSGEVQLSNDPNDVATTAGSKNGRFARYAPLPTSSAGALIGRIDNGAPFGIGDQRSFPAPASGMLYLTVNDDERNDNSGEFVVTVSPQNQYNNTQNPNQGRRRRPNY